MECIRSKENARFKLAKSLLKRKFREQYGLCLIEGQRLVEHVLLTQPESIEALYIHEHDIDRYAARYAQAVALSEDLFEVLSETVQSQGVIAVVRLKSADRSVKSTIVLALENIQDPGNLGTMIRTCDAVGDIEILLSKGCVDPFNPKVLRSAMGSVFETSIHVDVNFETVFPTLKSEGYRIIAADLEEAESLFQWQWPQKCVLVIGNEGQGLSEACLSLCDQRLMIPLFGSAESLNAAIAAGILLYDAKRQQKMMG